MKIETKYNIGQTVWFLDNKRIQHSTIQGYCMSYGVGEWFGQFGSGKPTTNVTYHLVGGDMLEQCVNMEEEYLFPTKEELLKSL